MDTERLVRILFIVLVIVFIIFAVVQVFRFATRSAEPASTTTLSQQAETLDYINSDSKVSVLVDGRIVSNEEHRAVRITVSETQRKIEVLEGYDLKVQKSQTLSNNHQAYEAFMHALHYEGFTSERPTIYEDQEGICPRTTRTVFRLEENGRVIQNLWESSCAGSKGPFDGNKRNVVSLFQKQIPEYSDFVKGVKL